MALLQDSLEFTPEFNEAIHENLLRQLYRTLDDHPNLLNEDSIFLNYYLDKYNSPIGILTRVDRLKEALSEVDSLSTVQTQSLSNAIRLRLDSIIYWEGQLPTEYDSASLADFEQVRNDGLIEIDSLIREVEQIFCSRPIDRLALLDSALQLNSSVIPETDMQYNEVFVNRMYYSKTSRGIFKFTSSEQDTLLNIAIQCPTLGGVSVFGARSMLAAAGLDLDINDDSLCFTVASRPLVTNSGILDKAEIFNLYPNPASDRIHVQLIDKRVSEVDIRILNALGQFMMYQTIRVASDTFEIPLPNLPVGVYYIQLYVDDIPAVVRKFVKSI